MGCLARQHQTPLALRLHHLAPNAQNVYILVPLYLSFSARCSTPLYISVSSITESIKDLYTWDLRTWNSIQSLGAHTKTGWITLTSQTASEYMTSQGISELFIHELQEALTRVNYGQVRVGWFCAPCVYS